jgi:hemoglobin/transferrin/lactoferrin receptor protein
VRFDWHEYKPQVTPEFADLNPGYDIFGLSAGNSGSRISPKLLATYDVSPTVQLFGQWSMAYRAPTVNELYLNFTNATTGYAQLGNPDLKPETGHGFEAGVNAGTDDFGGRVTVFHNRYNDFITMSPMVPDPAYPALRFGVAKFINLDEVHMTGIELKGHKRFDNGFRLHGGLAYTYAEDVVAGTQLREIAPFKAIAGIGYEQEHWGLDLTGVFSGGVKDDGDANTFDAPSYAVANVTGWWEPAQVKGLRIQAGVYNVFDTTYFDAVANRDLNPNAATSQPRDFYSEPGRSFKISLTQKF